jgi:hypothetical protein
MAQEIDINLNVNAEQADKSLGSLKSQLREAQQDVQTLADKFGATSKEAIEAAKKAADLKDRIGDAKSLTEAFNPDAKFKALSASLTGVAGGFSAVTGAMGAFGGESKAVEQTLLKVQSAMAMASGLQAVGESIDSFKQLGAVVKSFTIVQNISAAAQRIWNTAMAANPIGVIVVAVTALIAAGYALVNMFKSSSDATKKAEAANKALNKELDNTVKSQKAASQEADLARDLQLGMAKASGKSASEIRKLAVELANQEVAQKLANAQSLYAIAIEAQRRSLLEDASDQIIETAKKARKEYDDANNALKTSVLNRRKLLNENKIAETQEATDARKEKAEASKKAAKDAILTEEDKQKKLKEISDKYNKTLAAEEPEAPDTTGLENKAYLDAKFKEEELAREQAHQLKITQLQYDSQYEREEREEEARQRKIQAFQDTTDAVGSIAKSGEELLSAIQSTGLARGKAGQAAMKALALVQIGADSAIAFSKMLQGTESSAAGAASVAGPAAPGVYTATKIAFYASGTATILANIARAKALLSGGGGGGTGAAAGGGGAVPAAAPSFNIVGPSGANQIAESIGARESQPMRAFVVGGDVTTQQGLNRGIVQNATLG